MISYVYRLLFWAAPATPALVALGILLLTQPLACLLRLAWAATAALLLKDCDLVTKLLPEKKTNWPGRVAWVTGASSGIGLSLVRRLTARGCYLILSSRKEEDLKTARDDAVAYARSVGVQRSEKDFLLLPFDIKDRQSFTEVVETGRKWKGRIDLLFSNAGIACRGLMLPSAIDQEILDVNLCGQMHFIKLIVAQMMQQHKGQVIITNSMSSRIALGGRTAYSAAKAGLLNFAYGLSRELRGMHSAVTITSVLPGYVRTNLCDRELYADHVSLSKGAHMSADIQTGLSADRSAELILRGSSRGLREIWVAKNPDLLYMYCMYYVPGIANRVVDQGAAAYLHSIEHEIRERRYAERRAAGLASSVKGSKETQPNMSFSPATSLLPGRTTSIKDPQTLQQENARAGSVTAKLLSGDTEHTTAEQQSSSVYSRAAEDTAKIAADTSADEDAQTQGDERMKPKDVAGAHSQQKSQQHQTSQQSQQPHQSQYPAKGEDREQDGGQATSEEKREGKQVKNHADGADKHKYSATTHSAAVYKQRDVRDAHAQSAADQKQH